MITLGVQRVVPTSRIDENGTCHISNTDSLSECSKDYTYLVSMLLRLPPGSEAAGSFSLPKRELMKYVRCTDQQYMYRYCITST